MKQVNKWNYVLQKYEPIEIPENSVWYCADMDALVPCASCAKTIKYGDGYTSKTIHVGMGFGYTVCSKCYFAEVEEEWDWELKRTRGGDD